MKKKGLVAIIVLGIVLLLSSQVLSWTIGDPEIKDLSGQIIVRDYEGQKELDLQFFYLNKKSMNHAWEPDLVNELKSLLKDRNCLFLTVWVDQDTYFYPSSIVFVQGGSQYEIGYDDIIKGSGTFGGRLRAGVNTSGLIFIPDNVDVYSQMKIYYDDGWTMFSVPKEEEKELDIEEQIKKLEREKTELQKKMIETKKRIDEIDQKLNKLRKQGETG